MVNLETTGRTCKMIADNEEIKYQSKLAGVDEAKVVRASHHLRNQRWEPHRTVVT